MKKASLAVVVLAAAFSALSDIPEITSASITQSLDPSLLVTIRYTLDKAPAIVTVDIQTNGVSIGEKNFANMDGDVNRLVDVGEHTVTWDAKASWPGNKVSLSKGGALGPGTMNGSGKVKIPGLKKKKQLSKYAML